MSKNFIIVIEADNNRASAAYQKGLADIERIWPQIETYAMALDAERKAVYEKEMATYEAQKKKSDEADKKYYAELSIWHKSSSWSRGDCPTSPYPFIGLPPYMHGSILSDYRSVKADLKHMADVAGAAVGPFRMTEHQVKEMVSWEDGSAIDRIKARISGESK